MSELVAAVFLFAVVLIAGAWGWRFGRDYERALHESAKTKQTETGKELQCRSSGKS